MCHIFPKEKVDHPPKTWYLWKLWVLYIPIPQFHLLLDDRFPQEMAMNWGIHFLFSYTHLTIIYYHTKLVSSIVLSRYILICYQYRHQNIHTHKMYHCRRSWRLNPTNHHYWCSNFSKPPFFFGIFHEITMFTVESSHISSALTHTKHAIEMTRLLHLARDDDATGQAAIVGLSLGMCIIHVI